MFDYLIVGAGMTGDMVAKGIRDHDAEGSITMVGADPYPPYKRPLLTKGLWQGAPEEKLWREPAEDCELPVKHDTLIVFCGRDVPTAVAQRTSTGGIGRKHRDRFGERRRIPNRNE